ncbi:MAG: RagB/SusD family nutrient uptake outer membrane protein [Dysgonamonadaceae bacterium]|jgi:tetratricopeptide (TPR) repeat protein|nr:RagB/SusD family nutrient uptake outer membrane protein [Dysgonamonadaceae bacterium]
MKIKYIIYQLITLLFLSSCNDFLDTQPDNRVEWSTPTQISQLLVSAYSDGNYALLGELSSDNFIDNNSPNDMGAYYNLASRNRMDDEIYAWEDVVSDNEQDSPSHVWSGCYYAIAVTNNALKAIEKFEEEGKGDEVSAQKGEALLCRAYHHFILVNLFAKVYKNEALSKDDPGVPYVTEPETRVLVHYERLSVSDVYDRIEQDLLEGIDLIVDNVYDVPKYHFNKKAAHAFAARFYLFKREYDKVIKYANIALGSNPSLRNWNKEMPTYESIAHFWIDAESLNNFLLLPTGSWFSRVFGKRYGCNREAADATIFGTGPTWGDYNFHPCYSGRLYIREKQEYGLFFPKCGEFFEYTDKVAQIGLGHIVRAEFTAEETLLCRAEANVYLGNDSLAVADLITYDNSRKITQNDTINPIIPSRTLTDALIRSFYTESRPLFVQKFNTEKISPDFIVTNEQKPLLDCVLHFRRLETIFDGMRWFDIKRYGIEITHKIGTSRIETLTWDDPRRALQIPQEVIQAGMDPNNRTLDLPATGVEQLKIPLVRLNSETE